MVLNVHHADRSGQYRLQYALLPLSQEVEGERVAFHFPACSERRSKATPGTFNQHATTLKSRAKRINQRFFDSSTERA